MRKGAQFWTDESSSSELAYWIYCITEQGCTDIGPCKIGIATRLGTRLSSLQAGNWRRLVLVWQIRLSDRAVARGTEQRLLGDYRPDIYGPSSRQRLASEWIETAPLTVLRSALDMVEVTHEKLTRVA